MYSKWNTITLLLTLLLCGIYNSAQAGEGEQHSDSAKGRNTVTITASTGPVFLSPDDKRLQGDVTVNSSLIWFLDASYNFKRRAKDAYFSLGLFSGFSKFRMQEKYVYGRLEQNVQSYSSYFFAGVPLSGNFDFKLGDQFILHNRISAIPLLEFGHFAGYENLSVAAQFSSSVVYGRCMLGLQVYKPLGVYDPGTYVHQRFRLTAFTLSLGIELGKG